MEFLAISYHLPANPSRYRVATWKKLKTLGAVYLQPGVAVLPLNDENRHAFDKLGKDVRGWKGNASVLTITFIDEKDEAEMLHSFSAARTEEYQAIIDDCGRLSAQLQWEKENGSYDVPRYALEQNRLIRRLDAAIQHDFFQAGGREEAVAALEALQQILPLEPKPQSSAAKTKSGSRSVKKTTPVQKPVKEKTNKETVTRESSKEPTEPEEKREMPVFLF